MAVTSSLNTIGQLGCPLAGNALSVASNSCSEFSPHTVLHTNFRFIKN